jgi:cytochrome c biogenesis protein CcdA/glutaredoxin
MIGAAQVGRRSMRAVHAPALPVVLAAVVLAAVAASSSLVGAAPLERVGVYVFWGDGCPHCEAEKRFLNSLQTEHPTMDVRLFEVWYDAANRALLLELAEAFGVTPSGVPVTFVGERVWIGFSESIGRQIASAVAAYAREGVVDPAERLGREGRQALAPPMTDEATLAVPLLGTVDLRHQSLLVGTLLIALADGFNPCSLWVLALLLGVVVNTRSRRRVVVVGLVFLSVTALAYALFIAGLFTILALLPFLPWLRGGVAALAVGVGAVHVKDYFAFRRGVSLTIDDAHKPTLYRRIRHVIAQGGSLPATVLATAGLALGVTLVELPCTAGLPVLWTNLVAGSGAGAGTFTALLALYMLVYLVDELLVFGAAVVTMRAAKLEEREGRVLKLVGGVVMLALALAMLVAPEALESVAGMLTVFALAGVATLIVVATHWLVHPASSPFATSDQMAFKRRPTR